jgi:hypothetical protein
MAWMSLSPDGKLAATANRDWTAGVWNLQDFQQVAVLKGHVGCVLSTAFSPDGRLLVSTSAGVGVDPKENVKLWDTDSWTERAALEGHRGYVHCATFSPDGKTIATCGADLTIRLWNAADGKPLKTLRGHTASVVFVRFSPDGRRLASASLDGTVKVWNVGGQAAASAIPGTPGAETISPARADRAEAGDANTPHVTAPSPTEAEAVARQVESMNQLKHIACLSGGRTTKFASTSEERAGR